MSLASQGRQLPFPPMDHLEGQGAEPWVVEVLRTGYRILFLSPPPFSRVLIPIPSYSPTSIKGKAFGGEVLSLVEKGAVELAPPCLGYYSRIFVVWKATGSWRPVIDLSHLNCSSYRRVSRWRPASRSSVRYGGATG